MSQPEALCNVQKHNPSINMKLSLIFQKRIFVVLNLILITLVTFSCATEDNTGDSSSIFEGLASSGIDILLDSGSGYPVLTGFGYGDVSTDSGSSEANVFLSRHAHTTGALESFALEGSSQEDFTQAIVELGGGFYVAGHTYGDLSSDAAFGGTDIFLMRFNAAGSWQWTRQYGTSENDYCWDIATAGGDLFLVGNTEGVFPGVSGKTNDQGNDIILLKLDSSGNQEEVVQIGEDTAIDVNTYSQSVGVAIGVDGSGNIIIGGITNDTLGASKIGGNDIILAKYNSSLSLVAPFNIQQLGTSYDESITDLVTSGTEIYFTGFSYGTPDASYDYSSAGYSEDHAYTEIFLYNYDVNGDQDWVAQHGTATFDRGYALAIDSTGHILVAGNTNGDLNGTNAGSYDFVLLSYTDSGSLNWTYQYGSDEYDTAHGIAYDTTNDRLFVTGKTYGELHSTSKDAAASFSAFIIEYDATPDSSPDWTVVF